MRYRPVAFDLARLWLALGRGMPRGIERVDCEYARHLAQHWPGDCVGLLPTPLGPRVVPRTVVREMVDDLDGGWRDTVDPSAAQLWRRLEDWLLSAPRGEHGMVALARRRPRRHSILRPLKYWVSGPRTAVPADSLYVNAGHLGFAIPLQTRWLERRGDVDGVMFVHDLLSVSHPEFFPRDNPVYFDRLLRRALRRVGAFIVSTQDVRGHLQDLLAATGSVSAPIHVAHLPVAELDHRTLHDERLAATPYFVVTGTIEPRKNHLLLLNAWREMAQRGGAVPRLVIVGAKGWEVEQVEDMLQRCEALWPHVIRVEGLDSPGLSRLTANARAVLCPSFAEGFGLPLAEALALGTPAIAADIAVFREIAGGRATLLDPTAGLQWIDAIQAAAFGPRQPPVGYRAMTSADYFDGIFTFLSGLGSRHG